MALVAFVTGYGSDQMSVTLPFAREALGLTESDMSLVFMITRAVSLLGLLFTVAADRRGRRGPFLVAFLILPLASLATAVLPGVPAFVASQSIVRISIVAVGGLSVVILAEELSPGIRALGIGIAAIAGALGGGTALVLLPIAERSTEAYRLLFGLTAVGLIVFPLLLSFLKESRAYVQYRTRVTFRRALQAGLGKHFWPLAGAAFLITVFSSPAVNYALERLIDDLEWRAAPARFLVAFFGGIGTLGLVAGGRLADVLGRRPTSVTAMGLGLVGGVGFYTASSGWLLAPSILLAALGLSMLGPAFAAHRSELFPTRVRATAAGWVTNAAILGSVTGFGIGAALIDRYGLSRTISILGVGVVLAMLLILRLPETRGMDLVRKGAPRGATRSSAPPGTGSGPPAPTTHPPAPTP